MPQDKVQKFSALNNSRIEEIVDRCKEKEMARWLAPIARKSQELLANPQYAHLRDLGQNLDVEKLNDNLNEIANFLRACRLIGAENETNENITVGNYVIGAEGVALINEYMASKENNKDAHEVKIIKNQDLLGENDSYQTPNILKQQKAVHSSFAETLTKDLIEAQEKGQEFNKTYVIEAFGTTGGNHFFSVTVRKNPDENSPLIDFFDPSTALLRGNIETLQNSIATGWTSQNAVNATLTKALKDAGLEFDLSKYFNNLEPMQMQGSSNCSIFAYEKAYMTANLSREEHEALLKKHYKFDSPFGGKTEVEIDINAVNQSKKGTVENPQLNMPAQYMAMTHFNSNAEKYLEDMQQLVHKRKDRTTESEESKAQGHQDVKGLNKILPFPIKVASAEYKAEENSCEASLYCSARLATRLQSWARENEFGIKIEKENFQEHGFQFTGLNEVLAERSKVTLKIPATEESVTKISSTGEKRFLYSTPLPSVDSISSAQAVPDNKGQERK